MANYFIGDIQGCFDEFQQLLKKISFCPTNDTLYLSGDLIGRGPKALETLEFVSAHQHCIKTVLGNHDLHFLAIANGIKSAKPSDRFDILLQSPRLPLLVKYLRQQPLLIELKRHKLVLTHAGISPQWDLATAKQAAFDVSQQLKSENYVFLLEQMYLGTNDDWPSADNPLSQMIVAINAFTRMRYCYADGRLDFLHKCAPSLCPDPLLAPWFERPTQLDDGYIALFGHWASLMGKTNSNKFIALDTGCLWGNHLTAWCLEDQSFTTVAANN